MSADLLHAQYTQLCPGYRRLYVIPDIDTFSRYNAYLKLLYQPHMTAHPSITVDSFSVVPAGLVWRRLQGEKSIVHHHWFECRDLPTFLNICWKLLILAFYRLAGGRIVWTIHNREPHARRWQRTNRLLRRWWSHHAHGIHVHCQSVIPGLADYFRLPPERFFVVPHPPYPARLLPREQARKALFEKYPAAKVPPGNRICLMFGYIAPYKGILEVAEIFETMENDLVLLIAGSIKREGREYASQIAAISGRSGRVKLIAGHIPEDDVPLFFNSADVAVFNYRDILASGGVVLAQSYQKPVIVPEKGCLGELSGAGVFHFRNTTQLKNILTTFKPTENNE